MKRMTKFAALAMAGVLALPFSGSAARADYPERQITIVIGFPPGGADVFTRMIAEHMTRELGVPVVVENRPGASGTIGAQAVATARPDGYTILFATNGNAANAKLLYPNLPYDPQTDLRPIMRLGTSSMVITAGAQQPYTNLAEFIDFAKANPGQVSVAHPGIGGLGHVAMEYIKREAGIDVKIIPYTGSGTLIPDLLAGHIQASSDSMPSYLPYVQEGTVRYLAQLGPERNPLMPGDVPTLRESGIDFESYIWYSLLGPAGMPDEAVQVINDTVTEYLNMPETIAALEKLMITAGPTDPQGLADTITRELQTWGPIIKDVGVTLQ
ncbi:tripartite tricarboxylate transporter substrate binding protein [Frigidibacter albus]|uniref:Tripartite tricarboxylate transporter substrate binding protein n=1 Tax=Frigidibacter albus TaxID=1465486 RepID=A0A6L8VMD3_9RHOB|nr:tripartite tricarboxylate transporter substrate binding protein [Frigidibacter albus]MZQ90951.1 tripartite tricarboxylate transporter substrate binding protein [Frigidibacter albus]NBE32836.1 tripartite tricarboxylate transporter substrate binding protein [Frigidibacter albus]